MRLQQVLFDLGFPGVEPVVGGQGVFHLLHLAGRGDHAPYNVAKFPLDFTVRFARIRLKRSLR